VDDPEDIVNRELGPDERLLWAGRPRLGFIMRRSDVFFIPFSIMWGGFAIFWETMVIVQGAPWFFALWGLPFILVGLYMIFGRFLGDAWERSRIYYGVTSERVIIISGWPSRSVHSLNIDTLAEISFSERANGRGTITFGSMPPMYRWFGGSGWPGSAYPVAPSLDLPEGALEVYEIIRAAQRASKQRERPG
jgi:hypothetical protein